MNMKTDFLRTLKLILYAVSIIEVFFFGYLAEKTGNTMFMMAITFVLLAVNIAVYKIAVKNHAKKHGEGDGV